MKKKFLPFFTLPKLCTTQGAHYIQFIAENKEKKRIRYRPRFGLNREINLQKRRDRAEDLIQKIQFWLSEGNYFDDFNELECIKLMKDDIPRIYEKINIVEAIELARDSKINESNRRGSIRVTRSYARQFISFLEKYDLKEMYLHEFTSAHARLYRNEWIKKDLSNNTYNNKLTYTNIFFNWLVNEEYIENNPFSKIKKRKYQKAQKDNFSFDEMKVLHKELQEYSIFLYIASLLAFYALVRQEELARLKFKYFDVKKWMIFMGNDSKNKKDQPITLPLFLRKEFMRLDFFKYPANYYVFGRNIIPGTEPIQERKLNKTHNRILERLKIKRKGLSFSSWRRTGMDFYAEKLIPKGLKDHARHASFVTTEKYLDRRGYIPEIAEMKNIF